MLINFPQKVGLDGYYKAIDEMVDVLSKYNGVHTIFQVGGLTSPGISDIDFFVVFEDEASCEKQPLHEISAPARYLFTHGLFGTSKKYASRIEQYTLFGNYKKLWGKDFDMHLPEVKNSEPIKKQLALEYLIKMYLTQKIEQHYGIHNVRNFLLLAKAIKTDLSLLSIQEGNLLDLCNEVLEIRENWFESGVSGQNRLEGLINAFNQALEHLLIQLLKQYPVYLPESFGGSIARNIYLKKGERLSAAAKGFVIPPRIGVWVFGRKFPKLLNRFVNFTFHVPFSDAAPTDVEQRFQFLSEAVGYNRTRLPNFSATGYPLNIF